MATVEMTTTSGIASLHVIPTLDGLKNSSLCWNSLPESLNQPDIPSRHLNDLAELLKRHGVQKQFAMHLIHRHHTVESGEAMVGSNLKTVTVLY